MMKSKILVLAGLFAALFLVAPPVVAQPVNVLGPSCETAPDAAACRSNATQSSAGNSIYGPNGVLTRAARLIAIVVGIASVIMIIIGGFKYVTSSGDPTNVKSAKDTVLFAVVGILVALMAQSLVVFVLSKL